MNSHQISVESKNTDKGNKTLEGTLEKLIFFDEGNNYTVAKLRLSGGKGTIVITGNMIPSNPGETLRVTGEWVQHKTYGEQFQVETCLPLNPVTIQGIERYLGSGIIKGIGPVMAKRLVEKFAAETLHIIEKDNQRLIEVEGIGEHRLRQIAESWKTQKDIREVMIFLQSYGVSAGYSAKIYNHYGKEAIHILKENPYRLATDIVGIGFKTADKIAQSLGFSLQSHQRLLAGIIYILREMTEEGHLYSPYHNLIIAGVERLAVDEKLVQDAIEGLVQTNKLIRVMREEKVFGERGAALYLPENYWAEKTVANGIKALTESIMGAQKNEPEETLDWIEGKIGIKLAEPQKEAVRAALEHKVTVITGGPGTGKTTLIKVLIEIYGRLKAQIRLAAPTGRAAKRMSEATGHPAMTIHRMLEYSYQKGGFQRNEQNPLETDLLVVDEASMIDIFLMQNLIKAIPSRANLILVGDINQLPSVGPGNVLKDIITSGRIKTVYLTEIFRQARESAIVVNAHKINNGILPYLPPIEDSKRKDFYFVQEDDPEKVLARIKWLYTDWIPRHYNFHPVYDIQVLAPLHKGVTGVINLNFELQEFLNSQGSEFKIGNRKFRVQDKVMQIKNNYDKDIYNGDIGCIIKIKPEDQIITARYDHGLVNYEYNELDEIELAYAISVHKSQGSEYSAVIIILSTQHYPLLQRNLLYTALTRARSLALLVGDKRAVAIAVKNDKVKNRYTALSHYLQ
jgi:exodeoxyribonuclease V alpha subunit